MTEEDKKRIAEYMGWKYRCDLWGGIEYSRDKTDGFEQYYIVRFDLNDAGLVRNWLVERGEWMEFLDTVQEEEYEPTAWLFATENGEAVNFFRSFVKWCEEGNR